MIRNLIAMTTATLVVFSAGGAFAQEDKKPIPGLFGTSILEGWKKNISLGFTGTDGNVNTTQIVADAKGEYEDARHRRKLISQFYLFKPDDAPDPTPRTDRKAFVDYEENWKPFDNAFYVIGTGRYDYDRFQNWDHRIAASAGLGYEFINTETFKLRGSFGAGVSHTFDTNSQVDKETTPEGVLRVGADYVVMKGVNFTTTHTYYPNFDDTDEARVISDAGLTADIGEEGGLNVGIGVVNEYDSIADNGGSETEANDLTYFLRLGYDF